MNYLRTIIVLLSLYMFADIYSQQENDYKLNEITVTAGRTPVEYSKAAREVTIISAQELRRIPVNTLQDLMQFIGGVDIKTRGSEGVQSDISIRGATFEQTLIMIDGMKINDSQTGHHNLNLPVSLNDIERIEVVKGQSSKSFGPDAFGGVVNIITKKFSTDNLGVTLSGGEHNYFNTGLSASYSVSQLNNRISFQKSGSDGYKRNTEFQSLSFNYSGNYAFERGVVNILFGFNEKQFGANSFYSTRFPNQAEHTRTKMLGLSVYLGNEIFSLTPRIYWRNNNDEFVLNKFDPGFYKNLHETNSYNAELQATAHSAFGSTSLGMEFSTDVITSTNLGDHNRDKKGLFFEHTIELGQKLVLNAGGYIYQYSNFDWSFFPGLDASFILTDNSRLFFSVGKAFRIPTYTELFYKDQVSVGNANLKQEESLTYELGYRFNAGYFKTNISVFRREGKNIIDWIRTDKDEKWNVRNIAEVNTNGLEVGVAVNLADIIKSSPVNKISIDYTYLDSDKKTDNFESRYVLDHLKNQVVFSLSHDFIFNSDVNWFLRYEDRFNFEDHFLVDLQLSKDFHLFELYFKSANLFNKVYHDIAGVTLPGRWITVAVKYDLDL